MSAASTIRLPTERRVAPEPAAERPAAPPTERIIEHTVEVRLTWQPLRTALKAAWMLAMLAMMFWVWVDHMETFMRAHGIQ